MKIQSMKLGGSCGIAISKLGSLLKCTKAEYTPRKSNLGGATVGPMLH